MQAKRDENSRPATLGVDNTDGVTPVSLYINPSHAIVTEDDTTGTDLSEDNSAHDDNSVFTLLGVSSSDGVTTVPIYFNPSTHAILIKST